MSCNVTHSFSPTIAEYIARAGTRRAARLDLVGRFVRDASRREGDDEPLARCCRRLLVVGLDNPVEKLVVDLRADGGGNTFSNFSNDHLVRTRFGLRPDQPARTPVRRG